MNGYRVDVDIKGLGGVREYYTIYVCGKQIDVEILNDETNSKLVGISIHNNEYGESQFIKLPLEAAEDFIYYFTGILKEIK
ncbi:hypothetical protein [Gallibacterium anatis]|uniref:hypothetical protein n=1 Tax=Gallibacterium anatis TaxID=750 RepID=UPI00266F35ED|nr:hypothetical protein [Gallibacterium anatis]WKS98356.1 hypothetical protein NYR19_06195 [Gallibacterium anatis]